MNFDINNSISLQEINSITDKNKDHENNRLS